MLISLWKVEICNAKIPWGHCVVMRYKLVHIKTFLAVMLISLCCPIIRVNFYMPNILGCTHPNISRFISLYIPTIKANSNFTNKKI